MKKYILSLLVAIGLIGSEKLLQGATVVITDQTINQSVTISNFYSNNVVIDLGRQINTGDSISVSWTETDLSQISNSTTNQSISSNTTISSSYIQGNAGIFSDWQGFSSLPSQSISQTFSGYTAVHQYSFEKTLILNGAIYAANPLIFNTSFENTVYLYQAIYGRVPNPPNGYGNPGMGFSLTQINTITDTKWSQSVTIVPEPSTYALFDIGAIGMLMVMRRKKTA